MTFLRIGAALCLFLSVFTSLLPAQDNGGATNVAHRVSAGSDLESYLRYLQVMDRASAHPWSVRPLSPIQIDRLLEKGEGHPWQQRYKLAPPHRRSIEVGAIGPEATVRFNSAFPYGSNDGPVWAGRGLTSQVTAGVWARVGPLSLTLAPVFFRAENRDYPGSDTLSVCTTACGIRSPTVDRPDRFGGNPYQRLDGGASTLQLDVPLLSVGVSTANQYWGPAQHYPIVLGNNAAGIPHIFFQTRRPISIFVGRVHARLVYARLEQSAFSPVTGSRRYTSPVEVGRVRFADGLVMAFEPRGVDGLELGFGRFFHFIWPRTGIPRSFARKPLGVFFGSNTGPTGVDENQIASVFARWMFPKSGLEIYGEYGKEDNSYDQRDFVQEPDHARAYTLGFRKSYNSTDEGFSAIRGELVSFFIPPLLRNGRGEGLYYRHTFLQQGHTNRGQLLGADLGIDGGGASVLAWDRYSRSGKTTLSWERKVRAEAGSFYPANIVDPKSIDVWHAIGAERTAFLSGFTVTGGATVVRELNRDFADDAWNFNTILSVQYHIP